MYLCYCCLHGQLTHLFYTFFKSKDFSQDVITMLVVADPGFPVGSAYPNDGGASLRRGIFSLKAYVKTKELALFRGTPT